MNDSILPSVRLRDSSPSSSSSSSEDRNRGRGTRTRTKDEKTDTTPGVYANLDHLVRLQFRAGGFSFLPHQPVHSILAGRHASRLRGRGLNFDEIRRYHAGDDVRQIDWKVTARTRKTHTRVFTEERERSVLLLVDQRITMFFGSVRNMKSVTAAEAAALAAWRVISQNDRVGALVFNDLRVDEVRPQRSKATVMRILHATVEQNNALSLDAGVRANATMFNEALRRCERIAKHDFLICIISDAAGHDNESRELLTRIAQHNDVLFVFVFDPLENQVVDIVRVVFQFANELSASVRALDLSVSKQIDLRQQIRLQDVDAEIGVAARPVVAIGEVEDIDVPQLLRIFVFDDLVTQLIRRRDHGAERVRRGHHGRSESAAGAHPRYDSRRTQHRHRGVRAAERDVALRHHG